MEKRDNAVELFHQFLIGEPDKIIEANRKKVVAVCYLDVQLGSLRGILIGVGNIAERAGLSQLLAGLFEIGFADGPPELEAGGGNDFRRRVVLAAGHIDGNQFESGWHFARGLGGQKRNEEKRGK